MFCALFRHCSRCSIIFSRTLPDCLWHSGEFLENGTSRLGCGIPAAQKFDASLDPKAPRSHWDSSPRRSRKSTLNETYNWPSGSPAKMDYRAEVGRTHYKQGSVDA